MNLHNLVTALTVTFVVSVILLIAELIFIIHRRRLLRPNSGNDVKNPTSDYSAKELLYFFCFNKSRTRVDPSGAPIKNSDEYSPEDSEIDVFKLLEVNGPSRVLCTIKEDDIEETESISVSVVDSGEIPAKKKVSLQACFESESAAAVVEDDVEVEGVKSVVSSPCDSPVFFTPVGTPSRMV